MKKINFNPVTLLQILGFGLTMAGTVVMGIVSDKKNDAAVKAYLDKKFADQK